MEFDIKKFAWTREPEDYSIMGGVVEVTTKPGTDLWQRTYYHFRNDNAPVAITKILARKGRLDVGIRYILNGDKTQEQILTAHLNCDPGRECRQMLKTKQAVGKEGGLQYYF